MLLTETWLREHLDAEINIQGFSLFRSDRNRQKKKRGRNSGGVAIYLKNEFNIKTEILLQFSNGVIEALCLHLPNLNMVVVIVYRQPNDAVGGNKSTSDQLQVFLDELGEVLTALPSPMPTLILAGDFNLPNASWPACAPSRGASGDEKKMINLLQQFSSSHFLIQVVDQPTHRGGNVLDLILTNNTDAVSSVEVTPTAFSSHKLVLAPILLPQEHEMRSSPISEVSNKFDEINLQSELTKWNLINDGLASIDWGARFIDLSVSQMLDVLVQTCQDLASQNSPPRVRKNTKPKRAPRDRRALMRRRTKINKRLMSSNQIAAKGRLEKQLIDIELKLRESYTKEEVADEERAVESIDRNPKYFYSYARKCNKIKPRIGPLQDSDGNLTNEASEMAEVLSTQYTSAFSVPSDLELSIENEPTPSISDVNFTEQGVVKAIEELSQNSAAGPDRFPAILLKNCKEQLSKPIYLLWRKSLDTGDIPSLLKTSNITPIHKGGPNHLAKNYRPVALTSHIIKIFEKIIRTHMVSFLESNMLMNRNQHGFRAGRSCLSQLLQHFDQVTKLLEEGKNVDVIYLDFGKAFDKLDFKIALRKLYELGVCGKLFKWIESFLTGRTQKVVVQGQSSNEAAVISGVPQGSVIGPLLFLIMIGDIDKNVVSSSVSSFADDTRVLRGVNSQQDVEELQKDLQTIYAWANENNAAFNADKFECLRYGRDEEIKSTTSYMSNSQDTIKCCSSVRDLGVTVSSDACFTEHISNVCTASGLKCGWILRTFKTRERKPLLTLWKSLVQPILDYCCQLWSPAAVGQIQRLESVQMSYLKKVEGMSTYDYWEQLKLLNMYSLERRRDRYVAIYVWKVLEGLVPNFGIVESYNKRKGRYCTLPSVKSNAPGRVQTIRFNSLAISGPRIFNSLPTEVRDKSGCSVDSFKAALDRHLKAVPDEPRVGKLIKYCAKPSNSIIEY